MVKLLNLGLVVCNDLSDESDIQTKVRIVNAKNDLLRQQFCFCLTAIKKRLVTVLCYVPYE